MCKVIVTLLKSLCLLVGCMEESYSVQFLEKLENVFRSTSMIRNFGILK